MFTILSNLFQAEGSRPGISLGLWHDNIGHVPQGSSTGFAELGSHLSGGQRQRIAQAQALLSKPKLLILREATS